MPVALSRSGAVLVELCGVAMWFPWLFEGHSRLGLLCEVYGVRAAFCFFSFQIGPLES